MINVIKSRSKKRFSVAFILISLPTFILPLGCVSKDVKDSPQIVSKKPIIIAHRGASGYLPEHTLESFKKAIELGADFVEPDLVVTKDGHLIIRHENELSKTTNVGDVFPDRKTTKTIDGESVTGWFSENLTLLEIETLKAKQPMVFRPQVSGVNEFKILTFNSFLDFIKLHNQSAVKTIGIYPEIKHSTYFRSLGFNMEDKVLEALNSRGFEKYLDFVFIQSFEVSNLKYLAQRSKYKLVQLIGDPKGVPFDRKDQLLTYSDMMSPSGLKEIKNYAVGVGPHKKWLYDEKEGRLSASLWMSQLKESGLQIHPYTFRNESYFIDKAFKSPIEEYKFFLQLGVHGLFTDFPDSAHKVIQESLN